MKHLDCIASALLIIGGLNWGLVGLFDYNVVTAIFANPVVVKTVYAVIALAALWQAYSWYRCKCCKCECHHVHGTDVRNTDGRRTDVHHIDVEKK